MRGRDVSTPHLFSPDPLDTAGLPPYTRSSAADASASGAVARLELRGDAVDPLRTEKKAVYFSFPGDAGLACRIGRQLIDNRGRGRSRAGPSMTRGVRALRREDQDTMVIPDAGIRVGGWTTDGPRSGRAFQTLIGEFDPGSGRTLAACLTHASQGVGQPITGERVCNT